VRDLGAFCRAQADLKDFRVSQNATGTATAAPIPGSITGEGYQRTLSRRHVTMIAMGGAIGVGLFMGAGGRLASTGPALIFSYAIAGAIAYLLMRALGELVMYRQTSGSFVSYAG
jgi:L-asparagine permease